MGRHESSKRGGDRCGADPPAAQPAASAGAGAGRLSAPARLRGRRAPDAPLPGMVAAEQIPASRAEHAPKPAAAGLAAELRGRRERLLERYTLTQLELGGAFYEMAIRDHVNVE